jgi:hypothetical protein
MVVHLLQHVAREGQDDEDVKLLGVYSSPERAEAALDRARLLPGFRDHPDGFQVEGYELDRTEWPEGFVTVT